ncbi:hypothetical protein [Lysobacter sp. M2-1]|uniref:hypothetical protein n=1 Tax=Lysobacter sp. M2-1 TaxID=2916839 RepID=UPI001F565C00|nr:hypothetical protein [Lysobacter sp. M2-1]
MEGIHVVFVEAAPLPGSDAFAIVGGAYIKVLTTALNETDALAIANHEVSEAGWSIRTVEDVSWVTRDDYTDGQEGIEYFEQALIDGVVLLVHTYPPGPEDGDALH